MRGLFTSSVVALLASSPAAADTHGTHGRHAALEEVQVRQGVDAFFAALRNPDKSALREELMPEGVIFIHNRMNPDQHGLVFFPVPDHLANWESSTAKVNELMTITSINVDGDMAHVWGPYRFIANGRTSHCGINSMSLTKTDRGWKVGNTSFTMERPRECDRLGAPAMPKETQGSEEVGQ